MNRIIDRCSAIFASKGFLPATVAVTLLLYGINLVAKLLCGLYALFINDFVFVLSIAFLYAAYSRHNKNVQKGLLGAVLMWYLYDEVNYVVGNIIFDSEVFVQYDNFWGRGYIYMSIATMVLFAALFVNHFIINGDHHSRSANVFINQLLVIVIALISIASMACQCIVFEGAVAAMFESVSWHIGLAAFVLMLAAYESRFNAYKIKREEADNRFETENK